MSVHGRAGSKRRGNAPARRPANSQKAAAPVAPVNDAPIGGTAVAVPPGTGQAVVVAPTPAAPSRPPMPEQARPSRPPMPEQQKPRAESTNPVLRRFGGLEQWYVDTRSEMRKIVWPDRETTKNLTILVIAISVVLGLLLGGIDYLLQAIFEALP